MAEIIFSPSSVNTEQIAPFHEAVSVRPDLHKPRKLHSFEKSYEHHVGRAYHQALAEAAFRSVDDHQQVLKAPTAKERIRDIMLMYTPSVTRKLNREMQVRGELQHTLEIATQEYDQTIQK